MEPSTAALQRNLSITVRNIPLPRLMDATFWYMIFRMQVRRCPRDISDAPRPAVHHSLISTQAANSGVDSTLRYSIVWH